MQAQVRRFAIVGAGPCGLYAADRISRKNPDVAVDVFDRLPTPLGLVRYGVAADHQNTKSVSRVLERALSRPNVRFFGNIDVDGDISLETLRSNYDAVLVAVGAPVDRKLEIPGESLDNIISSRQLVNWLNVMPDNCKAPVAFSQVRHAVIIGMGNVALDVARLLLKEPDDLKGSDLSKHVTESLNSARIDQVTIIGRGDVESTRFSEPELKELIALPYVGVSTDPSVTEAAPGSVATILMNAQTAGQKSLNFAFQSTPVAFLGNNNVKAVTISKRDGSKHDIRTDLVVTCIGYSCTAFSKLAMNNGCFINDEGKVDDALYVAGWAATGPRGTIASGRATACAVADRMLAEIQSTGKSGIDLANIPFVDFDGWQRINVAEIDSAAPDRVREKIRTTNEMLRVARADGTEVPVAGLRK